MDLSDDQLDRYARHIVLNDVGGAGQLRLLNARVALVGAGGIGSPAALYLAAAGIGQLTLIDDDRVSLSNLQRQILHRTSDIGRLKIESGRARIHDLNPDVTVHAIGDRLVEGNARDCLAGHDLVIDGSDSFTTRLLVNDTAIALGMPLVSAALGPFEGQLSVFAGHRADVPCYRCLVPAPPPDEEERSCAAIGILGAVAGVMGSWAALEALKTLLAIGDSLMGKLLLFDARSARTRLISLPKDPACPACGVRTR